MRKNDSIVYNKAFNFSVEIIKMYKFLCDEKKEYTLSKQLLRSGTSIGANIREALEGQSKKDFISKISIANKEAAETEYWLELFVASHILSESEANSLLIHIEELIKILTSILNTSKKNMHKT